MKTKTLPLQENSSLYLPVKPLFSVFNSKLWETHPTSGKKMRLREEPAIENNLQEKVVYCQRQGATNVMYTDETLDFSIISLKNCLKIGVT